MRVKQLRLHQFRSFEEAVFTFSPSVNFICGSNAQGKTTLLEAIHTLMLGRSFRQGLQSDLIRQGKETFFLGAYFEAQGIDQSLAIYGGSKERKIIHNHTPLPGVSALLGLIVGVVMTPDDIGLIKGAPQLRRHFLDTQIAQTDPLFVHYLSRYNRAMQHRNQLLKQKTTRSIESWEGEMATAASYIAKQRRELISALQVHAKHFYAYLTGETEDLSLLYQTSSFGKETEEHYLKQWAKDRPRELMVGHTLTGPHKDDFSLVIGGRDVRYFASEGQQRSSAAALRMGEWKCLQERSEIKPLMMIDDFAISLDEKRKQRLLEWVGTLGQVFVTSTEGGLLKGYKKENHVITLEKDIKDTRDIKDKET